MLVVHLVAVPGAIIFFTIYIPFKYSIKPSENLQFIRKLVLVFIAIVLLVIFAIVVMSAWGLYASGAGAFVLAIYLLIYILMGTKVGKKIFNTPLKKNLFSLGIISLITIIVMIILIATLDNKNEAALEIFSFVIYLFVAYFLFKFYEEHSLNRVLMKNQIYVYSHKLMPMLRFVSSGNGSQGTMQENNKEYYYFFVCSSQFIFWTLLAGILLPNENRYIGFSLSALGIIIIYIYTQAKVHAGRSFKYVDISLIQKGHFLELQNQALQNRSLESK